MTTLDTKIETLVAHIRACANGTDLLQDGAFQMSARRTIRKALNDAADALSSIPEQGVGVKLVAMNDQTYRSPREDAAYYGSIWSLSTNQMAELEKTFKYHRDHTELGLITQEPDSSVIESLAPLADREKSADHEASIRAAFDAAPPNQSKRVERLETLLLQQVKRDYASALETIIKLQGGDAATVTQWQSWTPQAHTLAWIDRVLVATVDAPDQEI